MIPSADRCAGCDRPTALCGRLSYHERGIETIERRRVTTVGADVRDRRAVARMERVALCDYCAKLIPRPADPANLRPVTVRRKGKGRT